MGLLDNLMMKIAGKDPDGKVKGISVNGDGDIYTQIAGSNVERCVLIANVAGFEVGGGQAQDLVAENWNQHEGFVAAGNFMGLSKFLYVFFVVRTDATHDFELEMAYQYPEGDFGRSTGPSIFVDWKRIASTRRVSEWTEIGGQNSRIRISNDDSVAHTYDIVMYGIR